MQHSRALEQTTSRPGLQRVVGRIVSVEQALSLVIAVAVFGYKHLTGFEPGSRWFILVGVVVLILLACWRRGGAMAWLVLMLGLMLFLELRAGADNLGFPVHTEDLWRLEKLLFLGHVPTEALQQALYTPGRFSPVDYFAVAVHWSYFFVPYLVVFVIWLSRPRAISELAYPLALTFVAGLTIYVLLPGTPPWLAAAAPGGPRVYRVVYFVWNSVSPAAYDRIYQTIGDPNPVACLPSVHFAITFVLFLYSLGKGRWWTLAAGLYSLAMAWSLVYLGEHYMVDVILGGVVAWVAWFVYGKLAVRRRPSAGYPLSTRVQGSM